MKFTLRLRTASAPLSRLFYENELAMFTLKFIGVLLKAESTAASRQLVEATRK